MEPPSNFTILLGTVVTLAVALISLKREALTKGGTVAAILLGILVFSFGGWQWFALLIVFFVSSSLLTKYKVKKKEPITKEFAKGGMRDFWQVLANCLVAVFFSVLFYFYPQSIFFMGFLGVIATVNADTWATELGILSKRQPYLITAFKKVDVGTSGAVSPRGLLSAFAGAALIGLSAVFLQGFMNTQLHSPALVFAITALSGFVGSLSDSLFGATIQGMYYCKKCRKETERTVHKCGEKTDYRRGFIWMDNDVINLLSSIVGSGIAVGLYLLLGA
ncbi:DUF92 domain-containing protein [Candidatus Micrarchaeota archaeon]|nr:DUF92 domain-containing protein [Candidatus Micrarchaeota archaeon]